MQLFLQDFIQMKKFYFKQNLDKLIRIVIILLISVILTKKEKIQKIMYSMNMTSNSMEIFLKIMNLKLRFNKLTMILTLDQIN